MEIEHVGGKKVPVKGGGICIYCGWDGGEEGLHDEHVVPFSLGGTTELLNASCSDCESITSYLDGYLANAVFGDLRVHMNIQSRRGHDDTLSAVLETGGKERVIDLAVPNHPFFLNMPVWAPPGFLTGKLLTDDFEPIGQMRFSWVPPDLRKAVGLSDDEVMRVINKSRPHNLRTFGRAILKIAYCQGIMRDGLDGFRPLATPDIILGRYPNIAYFVGTASPFPSPPYPSGIKHVVSLGDAKYGDAKLLGATIRLFGDSGFQDKGMPFYTAIYGAEGARRVIPKPRLPRRGEKIRL
jgi:HNH endonuclease